MARRRPSNMLALALLALLSERPMHPYEMSTTLRERSKETSIKLNYGSLYTVVESLARAGLIRARETVREGRRPERTIYEITEKGRTELYDWLSELVAVPVKEFTRFEAALAHLAVLSPAEAVRLLTERRGRLQIVIERDQAAYELATRAGLPRLFSIEGEYTAALAEAEIRFLDRLLAEIRDRTLSGIHLWESFHTQATPDLSQRVADALKADGLHGEIAEQILATADTVGDAWLRPRPGGQADETEERT